MTNLLESRRRMGVGWHDQGCNCPLCKKRKQDCGVIRTPISVVDDAWRYWKPYDPTKREALIFQTLGIVACEECGGSGALQQFMVEPPVNQGACPSCNGHGWKVVSDD